jgi:hypothetical protein
MHDMCRSSVAIAAVLSGKSLHHVHCHRCAPGMETVSGCLGSAHAARATRDLHASVVPHATFEWDLCARSCRAP